VNGRPSHGGLLHHGDIIQIGDTVLLFSEESPQEDDGAGIDIVTAPDLPLGEVKARQQAYESFHTLLGQSKSSQDHDKRTEVLYRVSSAIYTEVDLSAFLHRVLETLFDALALENAYLLLLSPDGQRLVPAAVRGDQAMKGVHLSRSVLKEVMRTRESVLCVDLRTDQRFKKQKSVRLMKTRSLMSAPLVSGDEFLGVLQVDTRRAHTPFSGEDLDLLTGVSLITSLAIQRVRLDQQTRRFSQALIILSRVTRQLSAHLERDPVVREGVLAAMRLLGATRGSFLLLDDGGKHLSVAHRVGPKPEAIRSWRIPDGQGLAWRAVNSRKPVLVSHVDREVPQEHRSPGEYKSSSLLIVPVITRARRGEKRGDVVGALALTDKASGGTFSDDDREILLILANQVGVSLANADLYERATVDSLTRLYVRRFLLLKVDEEIEYHRRDEMPLSLLMIDIDNFKAINDSLGHQAGDKVLQEVGRMIRACLRPEDVPGRYGGEEFVVIIPNSDDLIAQQVADRIRKGVEAMSVTCDDEDVKVTISIGVSQLAPGEPSKTFIGRADKAMYQAKELGRNHVVVAK
ncbi:MAG: sensor domain-containing diguanylate cyclase, partial [Planctomycetota bacterium]|nr:sensor domain-containing diguanylate cyclase [Planctomycetota bacterium]